MIHRDEPLRRRAEDDLGLRTPAVRVAVGEWRGRQQSARVAQVAADRPVGRVEIGVDDTARALVAARKPAPVVAIDAVALDREGRAEAVLPAQQEIVLAMIGRHMDEAGTGIGGDEIAGQERARPGEEAAELVHRVAGGGACEVGAFSTPHDLVVVLVDTSTCRKRIEQRIC